MDTISDRVYVWLRKRILTGQVKPGERIDEKKICALFSVSRTPVREAVKRLSEEHMVDVVAQSATRASQLDLASVHEAYLIRRALEMESAAQAAAGMSAYHAKELDTIITRHVDAIDKEQFYDAIKVDDEFHAYIARISGLHRLWRTVEVSKAQLDRCRHIMLPKIGQAEATITHHRCILAALNSGNRQLSRLAMKEHLDVAYQSSHSFLSSAQLSFPLEPKPGGRAKKPVRNSKLIKKRKHRSK